jgi:hypothetical protein
VIIARVLCAVVKVNWSITGSEMILATFVLTLNGVTSHFCLLLLIIFTVSRHDTEIVIYGTNHKYGV